MQLNSLERKYKLDPYVETLFFKLLPPRSRTHLEKIMSLFHNNTLVSHGDNNLLVLTVFSNFIAGLGPFTERFYCIFKS